MSKAPPRIYWDSCVFVSHIEGDPTRAHEIQAILSEADKKEIVLVTSTFSVAEVAFVKAERDGATLDPQIEAAIDALWRPGGPVLLIEFDFTIAKKARDLMRLAVSASQSIKGKDAVHAASALHVGAKELHTYDGALANKAPLVGMDMCLPREQTPVLKPQSSGN